MKGSLSPSDTPSPEKSYLIKIFSGVSEGNRTDFAGAGEGGWKPENRQMIYDVVFRWSLGQNDKIMVFLDSQSLFGKGTSEIIT